MTEYGSEQMLIGYTNNMTDQQVSELADWADYHAKHIPNPSWKRAYALIREGADLLLRRRAAIQNDPPVEPGGVCAESPKPCVVGGN